MDMEREQMESMIIDYIDNKLNSVDKQKIEQLLMKNADAYKLYEQLKEVMHVMDKASGLEPRTSLKVGFEEILQREMRQHHEAKTIFFTPAVYRVAAAIALLILGVSVGYWINENNEQKEQLAAMRQEMIETKMLMMKMLQNDQSASQRIQGVNVANRMEKTDTEIVRALVKTMNEDPNSNVRLAALDALGKLTGDPAVRKALAESLSKQKDPVVQISLIQLLVKMKEKSVVEDLQKMVDDAETLQPVKDEAYSGILKLS